MRSFSITLLGVLRALRRRAREGSELPGLEGLAEEQALKANRESTNTEELRLDHLRFSIEYIEARIRKLNGESRIIIVIESVALGLLQVDWIGEIGPEHWAYWLRAIGAMSALAVIFLLLMTIRPSKELFSLFARPLVLDRAAGSDRGKQTENSGIYIIWFKKGEEPQKSKLRVKVETWGLDDFRDDLVDTLHACKKLIYRKMIYYRRAMLITKLQVASSMVLLAVYSIVDAYQSLAASRSWADFLVVLRLGLKKILTIIGGG